MKAILLAIGTEIVQEPGRDTNSRFIAAALQESGVELVAVRLVGDDEARIAAELRAARSQADLIVVTGGLGPTADDLTRAGLALATGRTLRRDATTLDAIRNRFERLGKEMPRINEVQADLVEGALSIANPNGTAPGQQLEWEGCTVFLLPGPPAEMQPMLAASVLPSLRAVSAGSVRRTRVLRIAAASESEIEELVAPIYTRCQPVVRTTILTDRGQVELHLTATASSSTRADEMVAELARQIADALPGRVASDDGRLLNAVVAQLLVERGLQLAVAESCTGGLLGVQLTEVPGASRYFKVGYVCYANEAKTHVLGVSPALIAEEGAVSAGVALAMARGAQQRARTQLALAVTGVAGPDGGTVEKPVGLVFVALAYPGGECVRRATFPGDRAAIRAHTATLALEILRRWLLGLPWP